MEHFSRVLFLLIKRRKLGAQKLNTIRNQNSNRKIVNKEENIKIPVSPAQVQVSILIRLASSVSCKLSSAFCKNLYSSGLRVS